MCFISFCFAHSSRSSPCFVRKSSQPRQTSLLWSVLNNKTYSNLHNILTRQSVVGALVVHLAVQHFVQKTNRRVYTIGSLTGAAGVSELVAHGYQAAEVLYTDDVVPGRSTGRGAEFTHADRIANAQRNYLRPRATRHNALQQCRLRLQTNGRKSKSKVRLYYSAL